MKVFSFSAVDQFEKCALKYKVTRLERLYPNEQTPEAEWGEHVHAELEKAINTGTVLPSDVSQYQPLVDAVHERADKGWDLMTECLFAIHHDGTASITLDPDEASAAWQDTANLLAGYIDLLMVAPDSSEAVIVDWKTNKSSRYANTQQLDLYALGVMLANPTVERITGCLMFICDNYKMVKSHYTRADIPKLLNVWRDKTRRIQLAIINDNFPPCEPTPLCGWCPHEPCDNWQQGQDFRLRRKGRK